MKFQVTSAPCWLWPGLLLALGVATVATATEPQVYEQAKTLLLHPAPAEEALYQVRLLPNPLEQTHGDATAYYMRALLNAQAARDFYLSHLRQLEASQRNEELACEMLFAQNKLTPENLPRAWQFFKKYYAHYVSYVLKELRVAEKCRYVQWRVPVDPETGTYETLIHDAQQIRSVVRQVGMRMQLDVAQGRWQPVLRDLPALWNFALHAGEHPTLIGGLIAVACQRICLERTQEVVQVSGCPNLYWALGELLPRTSTLRGKVSEDLLLYPLLGHRLVLRDPRTSPGKLHLGWVVRNLEGLGELPGDRLFLRHVLRWPQAVEYLRQRPYLVPEGRKLSPLQQVVLAHLDRENVDAWLRVAWLELTPPEHWQRLMHRREFVEEVKRLYAVVSSTFNADLRLRQELAMLLVVEALRDHLARTGRLPRQLDQLRLPAPLDPASGRPFVYRLTKQGAQLRSAPVGNASWKRQLVYHLRLGSTVGEAHPQKQPPAR